MYSLNIISCASVGEFFFCIPQSCASKFTQKQDFFYINMCKNDFKMCKSKIKLHNIIHSS